MADYLIVGPSWIGDMVMAQSLFMTIKQRDVSAAIDVVAPPWSIPVLARMPEVRKAIPLAVKHQEFGFGIRKKLGRSLQKNNYDEAIVLPRSWKSALVPFFAGIKKRTGFYGEHRYGLLNDRRELNKSVLNQTVKRFVSLGLPQDEAYPPKEIPRPKLGVDLDNQKNLYKKFRLPKNLPAVAMMAGAEYGPSKQWPLLYFAKVAGYLLKQGRQVWILGSESDQADGEIIVKGLDGAVFNLCGKTGLADAIDLIAAADTAICNDSGLLHVAAAVGTEIHALYGSTSPEYTPPLTTKAVIHSLNLSCSPCFQRTCRFGHYECLRQLSYETVVTKILKNPNYRASKK